MHLPSELVGTDSTPSLTSLQDWDAVERVPTTFKIPMRAQQGVAATHQPLGSRGKEARFFWHRSQGFLTSAATIERFNALSEGRRNLHPELSAQEGLLLAVLAGGVLACRHRLSGRSRWFDWQPAPGYRTAALPVPKTGRTGFTQLPAEVTGILFTNYFSDELEATNRIWAIGSGVALGDVDGRWLVRHLFQPFGRAERALPKLRELEVRRHHAQCWGSLSRPIFHWRCLRRPGRGMGTWICW